MVKEDTILRTIEVDGQVAGHLVSWEMEGEREVGYWLGKEFWGKGFATQALKQYLEIVTHRPLAAHVAKHNPASRHVLEKCGFKVIPASRRVLEKCGFKVIGEDKYMNRAQEEVDEFILRLE